MSEKCKCGHFWSQHGEAYVADPGGRTRLTCKVRFPTEGGSKGCECWEFAPANIRGEG